MNLYSRQEMLNVDRPTKEKNLVTSKYTTTLGNIHFLLQFTTRNFPLNTRHGNFV